MPPLRVPANNVGPLNRSVLMLSATPGRPVLIFVQLWPLFAETKTPSPSVPAYRFAPLTSSDSTRRLVRPVLAAVQFTPPSVERKTPPSVPAKTVVPLSATSLTNRFVRPVFDWAHELPLLAER